MVNEIKRQETDYGVVNKEESQRMEERYIQRDRERALEAARQVFIYMHRAVEVHTTEIIERFKKDENSIGLKEQQYYMSLGRVEAYRIIYEKLREGIFPDLGKSEEEFFGKFLRGERYNQVTVTTYS